MRTSTPIPWNSKTATSCRVFRVLSACRVPSLAVPERIGQKVLTNISLCDAQAEARREAEAGPQGQPQPRPPPKAYKARKAVPIKPAPSDNGPPVASIGGPEQVIHVF